MARTDLRRLRTLLATLREAGVTKYTDDGFCVELGAAPARKGKAAAPTEEAPPKRPTHGLTGPYAELAADLWPTGTPWAKDGA